MMSIETIKRKIKGLYESNPHIHINVFIQHGKALLENEPVLLKRVYPHIFQVESREGGVPKCHTIQYSALMTRQIEIVELKDAV